MRTLFPGATGYRSWGGYPSSSPKRVLRPVWRSDPIDFSAEGDYLPYGLGRSYGDVCLCGGGTLIDASGMDRIISFDAERGLLRCEAGMSFDEILAFVVPRGAFVPVSPGTRFVTVGGAIANDVHGKNHHRAGTFGRHVTRFELLRSDGRRLVCSAEENEGLFRATIGGMGLTGLIVWAEFRLTRIPSAWLEVETLRFPDLDGFLALSADSDASHEYTVAWIDCLSGGRAAGRGVLMRANPVPVQGAEEYRWRIQREARLKAPSQGVSWLLAPWSMRLFNAGYYAAHAWSGGRKLAHFSDYFHPLDGVHGWNRLYGPRGFFQYQCLIPGDAALAAKPVRRILEHTSMAGMGSFLAVAKFFGDLRSPGMMSFPRKGLTLTLDLPNEGRATLDFMERLDQLVMEAGGSVYPAKDARMSAAAFQAYFPMWKEFAEYVDPKFSSDLWRRVTCRAPGVNV